MPLAEVNALLLASREPREARQLYVDWYHSAAASHRVMAAKLLE